MKVKPISPNEIIYDIPDFVIEAVNNLLKKKYRGCDCTITAKEIISEGRKNQAPNSNLDWYQEKWMDFETIYEKEGWIVKYESPDRGGSDFDSYYTFKPIKKNERKS